MLVILSSCDLEKLVHHLLPHKSVGFRLQLAWEKNKVPGKKLLNELLFTPFSLQKANPFMRFKKKKHTKPFVSFIILS